MGSRKQATASIETAGIEPAGIEPIADTADVGVAPDPAPSAPPLVAIGADGEERPLEGGSYVRVAGKLVRQEA